MRNRKILFTLAGAITLGISAATLIDYSVRRARDKKVSAAKLALGLVGIAAGTMTVIYPQKFLLDGLEVKDVLDEDDVSLMDQNISEVLGNTADRGNAPQQLRKIEVDEETSIDDFI